MKPTPFSARNHELSCRLIAPHTAQRLRTMAHAYQTSVFALVTEALESYLGQLEGGTVAPESEAVEFVNPRVENA